MPRYGVDIKAFSYKSITIKPSYLFYKGFQCICFNILMVGYFDRQILIKNNDITLVDLSIYLVLKCLKIILNKYF